jgi:outer membrane protein OmpA-like peptidoglycan-associated protein
MKKLIFRLAFAVLGLSTPAYTQKQFKCIKTLSGTHSQVQNLRFSPDGKILATAGVDGKIAFWDAYTGKLIKSFAAHSGRVTEVTFSHSGKYLASAGQDGGAKVWKVPTGEPVVSYINPPHPLEKSRYFADNSFICFSSDDRQIFFGGANGMVYEAGANTRTTLRKVFGDAEFFLGMITGGCLTTDKKYIAVSINHYVIVIDYVRGEIYKTFTYEDDFLNDVVVGPDPNSLAAWSTDGYVTLWDHITADKLDSYKVLPPGKRDYSGATFSKDGRLMATGANENIITIWNISGRVHQKLTQLSDHKKLVRICRFSPTDNLLASASYDGTVKIWADEVAMIKVEEAKKNELKNTKIEEPDSLSSRVEAKPETDTKKTVLIKEEEVKIGAKFTLDHILFERASAQLLPESFEELDEVVELMKKHPKMRIELRGHTDSTGLHVHNVKLSRMRANSCKQYIVSKGISENRIKVTAYGGLEPVADNSTQEGRQKNRRVEMVVVDY